MIYNLIYNMMGTQWRKINHEASVSKSDQNHLKKFYLPFDLNSDLQFEDTFENAQWRKINHQASVSKSESPENFILPHHII